MGLLTHVNMLAWLAFGGLAAQLPAPRGPFCVSHTTREASMRSPWKVCRVSLQRLAGRVFGEEDSSTNVDT